MIRTHLSLNRKNVCSEHQVFPGWEHEGPSGARAGLEIRKHLRVYFLQLFEDH